MVTKNILVTGIGGNVGQGIIRNIRNCEYHVNIIGVNTAEFSGGNHLVDSFYSVSYAYSEKYIQEIVEIVEIEDVHLIIPSTDFEVYYLSKYQDLIKSKIATSAFLTTEIYLDKYNSFLHHNKFNIPFAETVLPSYYNGSFPEVILKPRLGRGSRGIHINPKDIIEFRDDDYIVQKLYKGTEVTTAFYVTKENKLLGSISMIRKLNNGMTIETIVEDKFDKEIEKILIQMIANAEFRGSANLQSIVTDDGIVVPFEINCRISGTNSIRANFGFEDVKYTLMEYLYGTTPPKPIITKGIATRIMLDVIYPFAKSIETCKDNKANYYIY